MSENIKIVTFNIRCCYSAVDGVNAFVHRAGLVLDKIGAEKPDVVCFQEVTSPHVSLLRRSLNDYTVIYNGRMEAFNDEGLCIMVRDGVELLSHEFFWLSPTPKIPASRFTEDQSVCPRIATTTMLRKGKKVFFVYNAHLDHVGAKARIDGSKLLLNRVNEDSNTYGLPVFIMGDFNAMPESECLSIFNSFTAPKLTDLTSNIEGTFHAFGALEKAVKIDYIFTDEKTASSCTEGILWDDNCNGIYLSDHYPVEIQWRAD